MDYYNVDKIIAEEEKLKIKFFHTVENFGFYINPSLKDIKVDTRADLPYFLVKLLLRNQFCELVENPMEMIKNELDAKSSIVDLKNKNFYSLNKNFNDKEYLVNILYERIGSFVCLMVKDDFNEDDLSKMSYEERKIIMKAIKKFNEYQTFYLKKSNDI